MARTTTQTSDLWVICNTDIKIGFVLTQGIFLQIYKNDSAWQDFFFFLRDKFQWAGAGDNRSNFPQKRMLQMPDSRPARTWPQLTSYFSDRMVWVGELKNEHVFFFWMWIHSRNTTTSETNSLNRDRHVSLCSSFFFCIQLLQTCAIYRQDESKQGREEGDQHHWVPTMGKAGCWAFSLDALWPCEEHMDDATYRWGSGGSQRAEHLP